MQWNDTNDPNIKTLRRIVMLLLALADLAECASVRSPAVRSAVLWLLRPGEAIARDHIYALTGDPRLADQPAFLAVPVDDGATAAMRIAETFRMLAALLAAFMHGLLATGQHDVPHPCVAGLDVSNSGVLAAPRVPVAAIERLDSS